jgi:hypothetical protein
VPVRRVVEDYEAKLRPHLGESSGTGKIEWGRYRNGHEVMRVRFKGLGVPDGESVSVAIGGQVIGRVAVRLGAGRLRFDSEQGDTVPKPSEGQEATVICDRLTLLSGVFKVD